MLSPRLLQELRNYWRAANPKPETYLFPSKGTHPNGDVPITSKKAYGMPCSKQACARDWIRAASTRIP